MSQFGEPEAAGVRRQPLNGTPVAYQYFPKVLLTLRVRTSERPECTPHALLAVPHAEREEYFAKVQLRSPLAKLGHYQLVNLRSRAAGPKMMIESIDAVAVGSIAA